MKLYESIYESIMIQGQIVNSNTIYYLTLNPTQTIGLYYCTFFISIFYCTFYF